MSLDARKVRKGAGKSIVSDMILSSSVFITEVHRKERPGSTPRKTNPPALPAWREQRMEGGGRRRQAARRAEDRHLVTPATAYLFRPRIEHGFPEWLPTTLLVSTLIRPHLSAFFT